MANISEGNHRSHTIPIKMIIITALVILGIITLLVFGIRSKLGFYTVKPGEAAAIQTFGAARPEPVDTEGLHWHWPGPIGKVTSVQVRKSRTAEIGFQSLPDDTIDLLTGENWQRDYEAATRITGDLSLLEIQIVVHYVIHDLNKYLFEADDPGIIFEYNDQGKIRTHQSHPPGRPDGQSIKDAVEAAIARAVGQRTIDEVLVSDREIVEEDTKQNAQALLDSYRTGLTITSVQLQEVKPPDEVQAAFDDVLQAREEKETRRNEALAFESRTLPEARGQAEQIIKSAEAHRAERIAAAQGEAGRFTAILNEYEAAPEIIGKRMYLETVDRILPRLNQVLIVGPEADDLILNLGAPRSTTVVPTDGDPTGN